MNKIIHTATLIIALSLIGAIPVFADDSFTVSTPLLPNVVDYQVDGDVTLDVNVAEINALEITLSTSNLAIDLTPHIGTPSFDTDTLNILVGTTNITGYTLTMASSYGGSSTTSLTRTESINNTLPTIDTISSAITPSNFSSTSDTSSINKWGYQLSTTSLNIDKTVYNPVLTTNTINSSTEAVYNDPTSITFGAKVDSELPAGNYRATLKFMAVTNMIPYLQNMTGAECSTVPAIYYDIRDNKPYTVKRLNDGNCWMMENLMLSGGVEISAEDTNTNTAFILPANTEFDAAHDSATAQIVAISGNDPVSNMPYGNLYNFCAASAGTFCAQETGDSFSASIYEYPYSICPSAWKLPTLYSNNEGGHNTLGGMYYDLPKPEDDRDLTHGTLYTFDQLRAPMANGGAAFTLAGTFAADGIIENTGQSGRWWSSGIYNYAGLNTLVLRNADSNRLYNTANDRAMGMSVRCVYNETYPATINFAGTGVASVTVADANGTIIETISASGDNIALKNGAMYKLTANFNSGRSISSWTNTGNTGKLIWISGNTAIFINGAEAATLTVAGK